MKRVTGIGGIFFKASDPAALAAWYRDHLGLDVGDLNGAIFNWGGDGSEPGMTIRSPFAADTTSMAPGTNSFMINLRVDDQDALLSASRAEGCKVLVNTDTPEQGSFGWVIDTVDNTIEHCRSPEGPCEDT